MQSIAIYSPIDLLIWWDTIYQLHKLESWQNAPWATHLHGPLLWWLEAQRECECGKLNHFVCIGLQDRYQVQCLWLYRCCAILCGYSLLSMTDCAQQNLYIFNIWSSKQPLCKLIALVFYIVNAHMGGCIIATFCGVLSTSYIGLCITNKRSMESMQLSALESPKSLVQTYSSSYKPWFDHIVDHHIHLCPIGAINSHEVVANGMADESCITC